MVGKPGFGGKPPRPRIYHLIEEAKHTLGAASRGARYLTHAEQGAITKAASELHDLQWLLAKYMTIDRNKHWYR